MRDALRDWRANPPAAFVIDLSRMPSHGRDVAIALRGYKGSRHTPLVFVEGELGEAAAAAKIKPRERSYDTQPIEGSDTLSMMSITANFEGPYRDILNFVHALDNSPRLLMIESLNAAPQLGSNALVVSMKIDTFVREGDGL